MKRRLFNLLTILSLLICLASAGMWVRSDYRWEDVNWLRGDGRVNLGLVSSRGELFLDGQYQPLVEWKHGRVFSADSYPNAGLVGISRNNGKNGEWWWEWRGFGIAYTKPEVSVVEAEILLPYWFLVALTALPPLYCLKKKRKRPSPGHRPKCGYDLRATPDRCPECGAIPKSV